MKIIISIALVFSTLMVSAQLEITKKATINWGEELKFKKSEDIEDYIGEYKNRHYILKYSYKKGFSILRFSKDMTLELDVPLNLKNNEKKNMILESLKFFKGNLFLLSSYANKKTKKNTLYYRIVDPETLQSGKLTKIDEFSFEKKRRKGSFGVEFSDDKSKVLVYLSKPYEKKGFEKFGFTVFDSQMNEIWKKDIQLPYTDEFFIIEDYQVNDEGDAYIMGREYNLKAKERVKGKPNYKYHILSYSSKGRKEKNYEIDLDGKFITDITFNIAKNGDLICAGLYSDKGTYSVKGTFFMTIDFDTKKVKNHSMKSFSEDFITKGWSDRALRKAKKKASKKNASIEMYEYDLKDFVLREDGGAVLLAEQYYVRVVTTRTTDANGNTTTRTTYHYYYNDVIVINISPKGKIEWVSKIDKYQHSVNDGGYASSYALQVDDDNLHLIYNEGAKKYYSKEELKQMARKDKRAKLTVIATVDAKGEIEKEILINVSGESTYPIPKYSNQINDNEMFLYTRKGKKRKLAIVHFD